MVVHFKKSASILTDQDTQMVGNDRWPTIIEIPLPLASTASFTTASKWNRCKKTKLEVGHI